VLPPVATGLLLLKFFSRRGGVGHFLHEHLGTDVVFTWRAVVAAAAVMSLPLLVRSARVGFQSVNQRLEEIARTLGASDARVFFTITLPLASRGIVAGVVLAFARAVGEFGATIVVAGNIPGRDNNGFAGDIRNGSARPRRQRVSTAHRQCYYRLRRGLVERIIDEKIGSTMKLEIRRLSLRLEQFTLKINVDLHNARTGIFGPSGAGKTSLLEAIAGLRKPETAKIRLDGELFDDVARDYSLPVRLRKIGYVPQDDSLFPHLSVRRNLLYGIDGKSKHDTFSFDHVSSFLQINSLLDRDVRSLSRGENQRIVIARALLSAPRLLLLDEPLTALDARLKETILQQLRSLHHEFGIPMLYVTHDPAEAIEICQEVLMLESGEIISRGDPQKLLV